MTDDPGAVIESMVAAVNLGDFTSATACFAEDPVIVEDIPPFRWQGRDAVAGWLTAMGENAARLGVAGIAMELGEVVQLRCVDERAYCVRAGELRLSAQERTLAAPGLLSFTLRRVASAWLIETLVWSGREPA